MASNMWTSDRRLYLNAEGKVVEADDPSRISLLVAQGGTIPLADAERYGLVTIVPAEVKIVAPDAGEKGKAPAPNKARRPGENKGKIQPRDLAPGEMLQEGDLPPGMTATPIDPPKAPGENT